MAQNKGVRTPAHFFGELLRTLDHSPYIPSVLCPKLSDLRRYFVVETATVCYLPIQHLHNGSVLGCVRHLWHASRQLGWEDYLVDPPHRLAKRDPICLR
jgi:hypothetical protein